LPGNHSRTSFLQLPAEKAKTSSEDVRGFVLRQQSTGKRPRLNRDGPRPSPPAAARCFLGGTLVFSSRLKAYLEYLTTSPAPDSRTQCPIWRIRPLVSRKNGIHLAVEILRC